MNSELKDRVFNVPKHIMDFLSSQQDIPELDRNENVRKTGQITYGQMKRILHDMKDIKMSKPNVYNFYGGDLMWNWAKGTLERERNQIENRKEAEKISNDISGLSGERRNPSLKRHTKNTVSPKIGINMISKPNSEKFTNAGMFSGKSMKLFEEINKMKKLMT